MALTIGMNVGSPSAAYTLRQNELATMGVKLLRYGVGVAGGNMQGDLDYARDNGGRFIMPMVDTSAGIKTFWDSFGSHAAFCGVIELGNESYLYPSSGDPQEPNGTAYWDFFHNGIKSLKTAYPNAKVLIQASVDHMPNWVDEIFTRAAFYNESIPDLVYGWSIHPYCNRQDPNSSTAQPAAQWQLNHMNAKLAAHGVTQMPLWATEWGFSVAPPGFNVVPDRATQDADITKMLNIFGNPANNVETCFYYELTTETNNTPEENNFGLTGHDADTHLDPSWTTYHNAVVANNAIPAKLDWRLTSPPPTPTAPVVTTLAATGITSTQATLNATVNPKGNATSYQFEYGTTTAYGSVIPASALSAGTGSSAITVTPQTITGLTNGVTYHFRISATNVIGTTKGSDLTFIAGSTAPAGVQIQLNPTDHSKIQILGVPTGTVRMHYAVTTDLAGNNVVLSVSPTSTNPGTDLYAADVTFTPPADHPVVAMVAKDANSIDIGPWSARVQTTPGSTPTPVAPTVVTQAATAIGTTTATLNATVNPNGSSTTYSFEYGTTTGYGSSTVGASAGSGTATLAETGALTGLTAGTLYHYRINATNATGTSHGADLTFTTLAFAAPTVTTTAVSSISGGNATFNGTADLHGVSPATGHFDLDDGVSLTPTPAIDFAVTTGAVTYNATGLNPGTYNVRLTVTDGGGTVSGDFVPFTVPGVPTFSNMTPLSLSDTFVSLGAHIDWGGQHTSWHINFGTTSGVYTKTLPNPDQLIDASTDVAVDFVGLAPLTTYYWQVAALNASGLVSSPEQSFTTADVILPPPPPTPPTNPDLVTPFKVVAHATDDCAIRVKLLDGYWEMFGVDRLSGVYPDQDSIQLSSNSWGSDQAQFTLIRDPQAFWPDLVAWNDIEIWIAGQKVWDGRIKETPSTEGASMAINVQCEGMQYHLDDDLYSKLYVHTTMTDWIDINSVPNYTDQAAHAQGGQVYTDQGAITIGWPAASIMTTATAVGVIFDAGPISRVAVAMADLVDAGVQVTGSQLYIRGRDDWSSPVVAVGSTTYDDAQTPAPTSGTAGAFAVATYGGAAFAQQPRRYVEILYYNAAATNTRTTDTYLRFSGVRLYGDDSYRSGANTALTATMVIEDVLLKAPLLKLHYEPVGSIHEQHQPYIGTTSFIIPDFVVPDTSPQTPRQIWSAINAYHNWIAKVDVDRYPIFQPRPTVPKYEIGAWSGNDFQDASANSGDDIYNHIVVTAQGTVGEQLIIELQADSESNLANRRGFTRSTTLNIGAPMTEDAMTQVGQVWLDAHSTTPFKGSVNVTGWGGARDAGNGAPVHPAWMLRDTGELLRLAHRIDPDTGGIGRRGIIESVSYQHSTRQATVSLDNTRDNLAAYLARLELIANAVAGT